MALSRRTFKHMHSAGLMKSHACSHVLAVFDVMVDEVQVQSCTGRRSERRNIQKTGKKSQKWRKIDSFQLDHKQHPAFQYVFPYISTLAIFFTSKSVENDFKRTGKNTVAAETGGVCVQGEGETFLLQM